MTRGVRHVLTLATAVALIGGSGVSAQQAQTAPTPATAPTPSQQSPRTPSPERAPQPFRPPQGFSVVLVVADLQASSAPDDVPPAARRALSDMKEFLPYKSYKLVDAAWILGQGMGNTSTRLRGPEEQDYEVNLATGRGDGGRVSVRFTLRDSGGAEVAMTEAGNSTERNREIEKLEREIARLKDKLTEARRTSQEEQAKDLRAQLDATERRKRDVEVTAATTVQPKYARGQRTVIDTTFTMDVGETVVVGTSRLRSNSKALIALLTAVPAKGGKPGTETR